KNILKITFVTIGILLPMTQGCTEKISFSSSRPPTSSTKKTPLEDFLTPNKVVRGPTGGGIGGGIRIADNNGKLLKNKKVEIYIKTFGLKEKIKETYTNSDGEIEFDSDTFNKIKDNISSVTVEFYDGSYKALANAEVIDSTDS
ncbi:MAG: hypothetical protein U0354_16745, partial [Candidatus Sericytochromatia bacterium]